jgi:3-phenylpropionate/cinnamic acid dioxygenase small subunit
MKRAAARTDRRARTAAPRRLKSTPLDVARCEQFLLHEARLLDDGRFDEWLALFTEDAWYWIPTEPDQQSPFDTLSLIYDDRRLLETRVRRLKSPRIYSQEPPSRTSRIVANVAVEEVTADRSACTVRSKFLVLENRRAAQRLFGGTALHRLAQLDGNLRIAWKRVDLLNCDAPLDGILVPL